jgi:signal transduction histidine kinase/CheY-like chemotaxis protein
VPVVVGGRVYYEDLRVEPLRDRSGAITGVMCVSIDITEAKRMKEALSRAVAVAERANATKSRFLAAASHDLRQPFQAMQLYYELLLARLTDQQQREICSHLGDSIRNGQELLTALLDVSTFDAGTVMPKIMSFALQPSLESLVAEFKEQTARLGIELRMVPTQAIVLSDRVLLERMLRNLVTNAVRYTHRGRILIGCRHRGSFIDIQVWDTGIGIPADKLDLIFEDFYQVGNPERRLTQGLGLGLCVVARTAKLLDHEVAVRSWLGRGSVFSVRAALVREADPAKIRAGGGASALAPLQVLIIEDDDMQRYALRLLLEDGGHTVLSAATPAQAIEKVVKAAVPPTVIISDLRLPGTLSGVEAIAQLRAVIGAMVPAILVTGDTDRDQLRHALSCGITVLHKPFTHAALEGTLYALLGVDAADVGGELVSRACS